MDWIDEEYEKHKSEFKYAELVLANGTNSVARIKPDDKRLHLRKDCSSCMANYKYAKRHHKLVLYNIYTEDIVGVCMESNTKEKWKKLF